MTEAKGHQVTAVTRSFNRLPFLRRAAESILSQKCDQLVWLIVNNGGNQNSVEEVADWTRKNGATVEVIHLDQKTGIWAASNAGVQAAKTPFLILHDDDDSWSPDFLGRTLTFLLNNSGFAGVSTQCMCVREEVIEDTITETDRFVMNADFQSCQLGDMLVLSRIVPIAFLYRASLHQELGWFRADLPVMGDWEFCLRVLTRHEIGVIPEPLANYHHRTAITAEDDPYGNTVIARGNAHAMTDAMIRNGFLRNDLANGTFGIGALLTLARSMLRSQELDRLSLYATRDELTQALSQMEARLTLQVEQLPNSVGAKQNEHLNALLATMEGARGQLDKLVLGQVSTQEELARFSTGIDNIALAGADSRRRIKLIEERLTQGWLARMRTHRRSSG